MANIRTGRRTKFLRFRLAGVKGLVIPFLFFVPFVVQAQFDYATNFTYVTNNTTITTNGTLAITGYSGPGGTVVIPNAINGYPVTSIANSAFGFNSSLISVIVPDSVTSIGFASFDGCTSLTNIIIGSSVTNIVSFPFYDCPSLAGIYFRGNAPKFMYGLVPRNNVIIYFLPGTKGWDNFVNEVVVPVKIWLPQIQTSEGFGIQANQFGFCVNWTSGQAVIVQACTNMSNPVWQPIQTNLLTGNSFYFSDPQSTNYPSLFYRISSQ
jgi:hypothetical protein